MSLPAVALPVESDVVTSASKPEEPEPPKDKDVKPRMYAPRPDRSYAPFGWRCTASGKGWASWKPIGVVGVSDIQIQQAQALLKVHDGRR